MIYPGENDDQPEPAPTNPPHVRIDMDGFFSHTFKAKDAWPDGEPEVWTAGTLAREIAETYATPEELISGWDLDVGYDVLIVDAAGNRVKVEFKG